MLDSLGGLAAGAALGLAIVWVAGAVLLQLPGQTKLRIEIQRSLILQRLNTIAPPRTVLRAFARVDPFPQIAGPAPPSVPPDTRVLSSAAVVRARPSVVKITATACGLGVEGSGWVARPHIVVTAAHVVAGAKGIDVNGRRAIAHDRRGHGRSSQPWEGNNLDTYADDLAELIEALDLRDVILVGHSTGGGEIVRYIGRHGNDRVAKAVLVGAIAPLMLKTAANPGGTPIEAFDAIRAGVLGDRSQFYADLAVPFYGANRDGANVSDGVLREFWRLGMMTGLKGAYDCIKAFSETDLTEDLRRIDVPTLIVHGNDDQIVPIDDSAMRARELVADAELKVYPGAPHGLMTTHKNQLNGDLLAFINS
jgi:non-heme chloroperoxidase